MTRRMRDAVVYAPGSSGLPCAADASSGMTASPAPPLARRSIAIASRGRWPWSASASSRTTRAPSRLFEQARGSLLDGVPMNWMSEWASPFPLFVDEASGAHFRCVDGHEYADLCLGDTGAMAGHGPAPDDRGGRAPDAPRDHPHAARPTTRSRPADELARRFGLPLWQFTLTATDANRFALRLARRVTGRSKVVVHDECYHGSVDETLATLDADGRVVATDLNIGPAVDPALTTRVVAVQRRRRARASARGRGRRRGPRRAGADERRHRPARNPATTTRSGS